MTSEAPEWIWLQWVEPGCEDNTWCEDQINDDDVGYIRADLHQQALAAAEARCYARAIEEAFDKVESLSHDWGEDGCAALCIKRTNKGESLPV